MPRAGFPVPLAACLLAVLLTGCGAGTEGQVAAPSVPGTGEPVPGGEGAAAPGPAVDGHAADGQAHGHTDADHVLPEPLPSPTWDDASRAAALERAEAAVRAFARPDLPEEQWMAGLAPLLTPQGAFAHQGTDPRNIPATRVLGAGTLVDDRSAYLAVVVVPTDAGPHEVLLSRAGADSPWLAELVTAPEEGL
ncbi:hypothetical protein CLV92_11176 [Kineococcus xinjiangensis]|uniref:Lipoprotein n=1 Tax=Kineococcus xinjiangensis TaxID=512762 RepID=A0A2S6IG17_9ACTN|nr:hypothetical protein [Kineococcus xinjiangensis]PPK93159.1 hypothetical protein CLV92_11176 [Kineococcus xinjiangensis]